MISAIKFDNYNINQQRWYKTKGRVLQWKTKNTYEETKKKNEKLTFGNYPWFLFCFDSFQTFWKPIKNKKTMFGNYRSKIKIMDSFQTLVFRFFLFLHKYFLFFIGAPFLLFYSTFAGCYCNCRIWLLISYKTNVYNVNIHFLWEKLIFIKKNQ